MTSTSKVALSVPIVLVAATAYAFGPSQGTAARAPNDPAPVRVDGPTTAFGELLAADPTPVVQIDAVYGLDTEQHETFSATGGSATASSRMFTCQTGTSVGGYGVIRSRRALRYRPGQGSLARFTALYTTPVALSQQMAGAFSAENGLFFGYNGTSFGVCRQYGGALEIQTLTVSAGASGTESVTVTLNGVGSTFNLSTGSATANAITIASQSYTGWSAYQVGATVVFVAQAVGDKTSTFSFANNAGGGTAAAGFVETQAGAAHSEDWVYQSSWNVDPMTGTGPSGMTLDPTKGNVYEIRFQWLGFGLIEFAVEDEDTGRFQVVHRIEYANANTTPSLANPSLKIGWVAYSLGSTTNLTVKGASAAMFVTGKSISTRDAHGISNSKSSIGTSYVPILTIRASATLGGRIHLGKILPRIVSVAADGTKPVEIAVINGTTLGGTPSWTSVSSHTGVEYDTAGTTVTGGTTVLALTIGKSESRSVDIASALGNAAQLERTDTLTIAAKATSSTTDVSASITWADD
jgi:hypothetical protein